MCTQSESETPSTELVTSLFFILFSVSSSVARAVARVPARVLWCANGSRSWLECIRWGNVSGDMDTNLIMRTTTGIPLC